MINATNNYNYNVFVLVVDYSVANIIHILFDNAIYYQRNVFMLDFCRLGKGPIRTYHVR